MRIRALAREVGVSTDTVIKGLKKRGYERVGEQRIAYIS
jgi:DNA-binding MurR/RpiR family transcriptional regulator